MKLLEAAFGYFIMGAKMRAALQGLNKKARETIAAGEGGGAVVGGGNNPQSSQRAKTKTAKKTKKGYQRKR